MQTAAEFWDKVAPKYAESPISDMEAYTYTLDRTRRYLAPNDTVLEVGCGTGSTALLLADGVEHITASDVSPNMIAVGVEKAREQGVSNIDFVTADLFDSVLDRGAYDAVLAHNMLHLLEDIPAAVRRIGGLLKPGGIFISKTVCRPGPGAPLKFRLMRVILPLMQMVGKAPSVNFMEIEDLEDCIASAGFAILESGNHPPPSRYIVARKL